MARSYRILIDNMRDVKNVYAFDIISDIQKYYTISQNILDSIQSKLNSIFKPFIDNNISICVTTETYNSFPTYIEKYMGYFRINFSLRTSTDNTVNSFTAHMIMYIDYNSGNIELKGYDLEKNELEGNFIIISRGRRTVFKTHGGSNSYYEWYNIQNGDKLYSLAKYLSKKYYAKMQENLIKTKEQKVKNRSREFIIDEVRTICDVINQHNNHNIFAHFYDDGKDYMENKFSIIINNRNDYQDIPVMSYQYRDCDISLPTAELASLKYFSSADCITISLVKNVDKDWYVTINWPCYGKFSEFINKSEFSSKYYSSIENIAETVNMLIEKDMKLCNNMNQIWF
ncbi:MAG: hypothetical protein MJ211_09750 [Bacteroidales bacterium]|nr:hypothetical protein [Bacteroidales bacterium]